MKNIRLIIIVFFISSFGYSQTNEIKVKFIGNCGLYLTDGNLNIYIDFPYKSGAHNYMEYDRSEIDNIKENPIFIFTHKHSDHYSRKLLKKLNGKKYGSWNVSKLKELNSNNNSFSITSFKTKHRFCFNHYSYLITWHDKRIYISGDTEDADTIATISGIDWAFIPVWLLMDAKEKGIKLSTNIKMIGIYHIGPNDNITTDDSKFHLLDKQGKQIKIPY